MCAAALDPNARWKGKQIARFLEIYQEYPLLWNIKMKDYRNTKLKNGVFTTLMEELEAEGLLGSMDDKKLKAKIKAIKDVYRQELAKIEKSKKCRHGEDAIYKPKLAWFNKAEFMREVISTRESQSSLCPTKVKESAGSGEAESLSQAQQESQQSSPMRSLKKSSEKITLSVVSTHKLSRQSSIVEHTPEKFDENLEKRQQKEDSFDYFGKYVAAELRQLPKRPAILLQQEIQNAITRTKLSRLEHEVNQEPFVISIPSPSQFT